MKLQDFDFRVWDNKDNNFLKAKLDYLCIANKDRHKDYERILDVAEDCSGYDSTSYFNYTDDRYEIELFTGFYDKNGKKIYENGILYSFEDCAEGEAFKYKVVLKKGAFYLVECGDNGEEYDEDLISEFQLTELEIIGNIHENPELLKN
ncbi:hypothetical protein IY804_03265 [Campylobacter volucris]|uniref:YopX family protein n=1 Tax=Campylobacter volucris TaxID=1031542 RepID=UPI0018A0D29E|nr:YopX family protein [Campylobacter volucris]MBF7047098.1 hypothetical protein [Campylobacter volucris]